MGWIREGYCCNCGTCCLTVLVHHMMDLAGRCKYIDAEGEKFFCEIRAAVEAEDEEFLELIPEQDLDYWQRECKDYPDPTRAGHVPPIHTLYEKCTYVMRESDGVAD